MPFPYEIQSMKSLHGIGKHEIVKLKFVTIKISNILQYQFLLIVPQVQLQKKKSFTLHSYEGMENSTFQVHFTFVPV